MVLLPMLEEFDTKLAGIATLVREMEEKNPAFPEHCNSFLVSLEELARRYSLPVASGLSVQRGEMLCKVVQRSDDRKATLRLRDEHLMAALAGSRSQLEDYFAPWRKTFMECGSLCRQMAAGAALKGLLTLPPQDTGALGAAWHGIVTDAELAPVLAHVVGLAGAVNTRILLDQSLASSCAGLHPPAGKPNNTSPQ